MAIALDANLGSTGNAGFTTTNTVVTGAAAAAGSKIFAVVSWFNPTAATMTVSGGSLTWTSLFQVNNGSDRIAIWCADAPSGLASGTTLTATQAGSPGGFLANYVSFTGLATGTAVDTTAQNLTTGASWSSGAATNTTPDALFIGGAGNETATSTTSTPTSGTELADVWTTSPKQGFATGYTIAATSASRSIAGSWVGASSTATTGALVVFPIAAAASAPPPAIVMAPIRGAR